MQKCLDERRLRKQCMNQERESNLKKKTKNFKKWQQKDRT